MSPKDATLVFIIVLSLFLPIAGTHANTVGIKKCKDATGQWHYGDTAADECAKSKVTVITEQGTTRKVIAAPPTEQELKEREARREIEEAEEKAAAERAKKDSLLLTTYGGEEDINYIRDRKIAQVETTIQASEETLKSLRAALERMEVQAADEKKSGEDNPKTEKNIQQTNNQIKRHQDAIAEKRQEQEALRQQYAADLKRYRELKRTKSLRTAPAETTKR